MLKPYIHLTIISRAKKRGENDAGLNNHHHYGLMQNCNGTNMFLSAGVTIGHDLLPTQTSSFYKHLLKNRTTHPLLALTHSPNRELQHTCIRYSISWSNFENSCHQSPKPIISTPICQPSPAISSGEGKEIKADCTHLAPATISPSS